MTLRYMLVVSLALLLVGCQTTLQVQRSKEKNENVEGALSAVAGALSGKALSKEEVRNLEKQIQTDEDAQTAIEAITDSVGGKDPRVKYCPVTGKRYAPYLEICPEHKVKLEVVHP